MANKRDLKKSIREICGDLAMNALLARMAFPDKVDENAINSIINEIAALQEDTIALSSFSYDKTPKSFATPAEYRRARRAYFATAYKKLDKDFLDRAIEILKQLNEAVPSEVRKAVSEK